jgi:hypothetical protein
MSISVPQTILGSEPVTVRRVDGTELSVRLRQLTIRQLYTFCQHLTEEKSVEMVAACTGLTPEQVDELDLESFGVLQARVMAENFPKAVSLMQRDPLLAAKLVPVFVRLQTVAQSAMKLSSEPSPAPAPSVSAEATGNGSST